MAFLSEAELEEMLLQNFERLGINEALMLKLAQMVLWPNAKIMETLFCKGV